MYRKAVINPIIYQLILKNRIYIIHTTDMVVQKQILIYMYDSWNYEADGYSDENLGFLEDLFDEMGYGYEMGYPYGEENIVYLDSSDYIEFTDEIGYSNPSRYSSSDGKMVKLDSVFADEVSRIFQRGKKLRKIIGRLNRIYSQ